MNQSRASEENLILGGGNSGEPRNTEKSEDCASPAQGNQMKDTDQIAAEAAEAYYKYEADAWDIYLGHRDKLQAIIKTAIEKALSGQRIYGEWGTAVVIDDEFSSVKGRAARASEPWTVDDDYIYQGKGWPKGKFVGRAYDKIEGKRISDAHNATLQPAHASEQGAVADAEYVLRWMKQCRDFGVKGIPENIIGLQENIYAALSQRPTPATASEPNRHDDRKHNKTWSDGRSPLAPLTG